MGKPERFTKAIFIRCTPSQQAQFSKEARRAGLNLASWLRSLAVTACQKEKTR